LLHLPQILVISSCDFHHYRSPVQLSTSSNSLNIITREVKLIFLLGTVCLWVTAFSFTRFLDRTQRRTTVGGTPLGEWSARRRDLYLTTHNTHNRQTSMPPVGFEPTISAGEQPQTYALDGATTGTGISYSSVSEIMCSNTNFNLFFTYLSQWLKRSKGNGKVHPTNGHEGHKGSRGLAILFL